MKSLIMIVGLISALCLRAGVAAIQSEAVPSETSEDFPYVYDLEDGAMALDAIAKLSLDLHERTYLQKTRGYISHIQGAVGADLLDRRGFRSEVACFSQNSDGSVFRTFGNSARRTQNKAVTKCFAHRGVCEALGCTAL